MANVLVTGGSGFLAAHTIVQLLNIGSEVRTTIRALGREPELRAMVAAGGADPTRRLSVALADLTSDAGWNDAMEGIDYVLHIASPFPPNQPNNENDLIVPARDGTLRVLRAARDAGVKRVVMTSSFAAIGYGHNGNGPFDENDWSDVNAFIPPYIKSKIIAERAAWDFVNDEHDAPELSVINPTGMFGPALGRKYSSSLGIVDGLMEGHLPFLPDISFGVADVRDVAALHLLAMSDPHAAGERFIATGGVMTLADIANVLRLTLGDSAKRVPRWRIPTWLLKLITRFRPELKSFADNAGIRREPRIGKAQRILGWQTRTTNETIADTARSLIAIRNMN
ncbi:SDR family oxidoreductase [Bifidobacterium aquikefiri]|uniref:SDR family oxidoreductase n=1 Tax=Bifidobacterium aquikefiri TaxID=1653207 RepID=UPI0039EA0C01